MDQNGISTKKKIHFEIDSETGTMSYDSTKKYFSRFGIALFIFFIVDLLAGELLYSLLLYFYPMFSQYALAVSLANYALSFVPTYCIALPVFLALVKRLPEVKLIKTKMKFGSALLGFCICIAMMIAGNYVSTYVMTFFQTIKGEEIVNPIETLTSANAWWVNLLFTAILAPILEELVFRKIICRHLLPLGEGWAIMLSGFIFGLAHGNFYQFFYAFLLGAFFAFIYIKTGKLIYTVIYHIAINTIGAVIVPAILEFIDIEWLMSLLEDPAAMEVVLASMEQSLAFIISAFVLLAYCSVLYGIAVVGIVFFIIALTKKKFAVDGGILPPVKKGKYSALFLNVGTALTIAYFAYIFVRSIVM